MKTFDTVVAEVGRRLERTWQDTLDGGGEGWPWEVALGQPSGRELADDFATVQRWAVGWVDAARSRRLLLRSRPRRAGSTVQTIPTHLVVPDADAAAQLAGRGWPATLAVGRARLVTVRNRFADVEGPQRAVRAARALDPVDFELAVEVAAWVRAHPRSGLTARAVPVAGMQSKWLDRHRGLVRLLAGVDDLGLVEVRTTALHFTYLDPDHVQAGGRLHDSVTPGTPMVPAYRPRVVIVSENKDTAVAFPALPGAVSVQGAGSAGPVLAAGVDWIVDAPVLLYWGDLDARGFEIVHQYRARGVPVTTILMDPGTLVAFEKFRSNVDERGRALVRTSAPVPDLLTRQEADTYRMIADAGGGHPVRVEQERIPLTVALAAAEVLAGTAGASG